MSPLLSVGLVLVIVAITAVVALALARRGRPAPQEARPTWMGADAVGVEAELRRELDQARWAEGHPPLRSDTGLDEMARHRAHALTEEDRASLVDDHGGEANAGRLRLYPELLGAVTQTHTRTEASDGATAVEALLPALTTAWRDPRWTAGAVGVSVRGEVVTACVVLARRVVILESAPWIEAATFPGEAQVTQAALRLAGVVAEAAPAKPLFSMRPPDGERVELPSGAASRGKIELEITLRTEGVHELFVDDESIFIFRFGDHR